MVSQNKLELGKHKITGAGVKLAMAALLLAGLSACGGGGDTSDGAGGGDLRAAYDRINSDCMTHEDVEKAVGRPADETPSLGRRNWISGNHKLYVNFTPSGSGIYVINGVAWVDLSSTNELEKGFDPQCSGL